MRAGVMIAGRVVMAPSRIDTTGPNGALHGSMLSGVKVYVNGNPQPGVIAYDEDEGMVLIRNFDTMGEALPPYVKHGRVQAIPRPHHYAA